MLRKGFATILAMLAWTHFSSAFTPTHPPSYRTPVVVSLATAATAVSKEAVDLPWGELQEWALTDNLPKYSIVLKNRKAAVVLWRTMMRDVPELDGYPIDFLQTKTSGESLPYLDDFCFAASGGLEGRAYGVPGIADGTRLETAPVQNVQLTVPKGYVQTADESMAFELGTPASDMPDWFSQLGRTTDAASQLARAADSAAIGANLDLVKLGALTSAVLGSAVAVNMLHHHLTINVFWV